METGRLALAWAKPILTASSRLPLTMARQLKILLTEKNLYPRRGDYWVNS